MPVLTDFTSSTMSFINMPNIVGDKKSPCFMPAFVLNRSVKMLFTLTEQYEI